MPMHPYHNNGFFSYSKSEIRGLLILLLILVVLLVLRWRQRQVEPAEIVITHLSDTVYQSSQLREIVTFRYFNTERKRPEVVLPVDPNTAAYHELLVAGLSPGASVNLIRYRESGGIISKLDELHKIYGIEKEDISLLSKNLIIRENNFGESGIPSMRHLSIIELNSADTAQLKLLPGIGEVLSARIVRYRELLGGFYHQSQLSEVYGISDSLYLKLIDRVTVDTSRIRKIDLNRAGLYDLQRHPYLNRYQAKAILGFRRLRGKFTDPNQLIDNYLIPEEVYYRILAYLDV